MESEKVPMIKYAMHCGAILGLFWILRYLFLIGSGFSDVLFIYIYYILNIGSFFLIYMYYFKYKMMDTDNPKSILECIVFTVAMCFFASFFEGTIMYAHYQVIHPEFFMTKMVDPMIKMVNAMPYTPYMKDMMLSAVNFKGLYIFSNFIGNITLGLFLSLVLGLLTRVKKD